MSEIVITKRQQLPIFRRPQNMLFGNINNGYKVLGPIIFDDICHKLYNKASQNVFDKVYYYMNYDVYVTNQGLY